MTLMLGGFATVAALLWLSVFGYVLALRWAVRRRRAPSSQPAFHPAIGVVVPTLNEERFILAKLEDLRRTAYPADRMTIVVVDGGSTDQTVELVEHAIAAGAAVRLVRGRDLRGKAAQLNRALAELTQEIAIVTDVDARLDPHCIPELVRMLTNDPQTAVAGATVSPATALLEEHLHWGWLNYLWWLEGEALSCGTVAAPCYAIRRAHVPALAVDVRADDVHLAIAAAARGLRVRTCRTAHATEVRVPQTLGDLVRYRRRRAREYVVELERAARTPGAPPVHRAMRLARLWQLRVVPHLSLAFVIGIGALFATGNWIWAALTLAGFTAPALFIGTRVQSASWTSLDLGWAAARLAGLTCLSLLWMRTSLSLADPAPSAADAGRVLD
jgi:hypothetical protein